MLSDFNHTSGLAWAADDNKKMSRFTERVSELIDQALCAEHKAQPERDYLGKLPASGENCSRKLQYEYTNTPKDEGFPVRPYGYLPQAISV